MSARSGFSLVELSFGMALGLTLLAPLVELAMNSSRTASDLCDRELVEALCLDTIERLKTTALDRPVPGGEPTELYPEAPPLADLFGPLELDPKATRAFDAAYLDQLEALAANIAPAITRTPDPADPALFKLEVTIRWRDRSGRERQTTEARWCWAPPLASGSYEQSR